MSPLVDRGEGKEYHEQRLVMVECPICGARRGEDFALYSAHLAEHEPEELGLGVAR
jgi:hypothetical protein